jgi:MoaA/NifB/PqqE/SkfB family radical SAM enzyme
LEPRPWGGYLKSDPQSLFSENDRKAVTDFYLNSIRAKEYRKYPLISYLAYLEAPEQLGCLMGGNSHFYIDSLGNVEPCVFLPVSFGNIMEEDFFDIYKKMRKAIPSPLYKQCPSVYISEQLRDHQDEVIDVPIPFRRIEKYWNRMYT